MDLGLLYRALAAHQVDIVAGNSTDGPIQAFGLTASSGRPALLPALPGRPLVREDSLARHPEIQIAMDKLAGKVTAEDMQTMNDAIDGKHQDVTEVVRQFRTRKDCN